MGTLKTILPALCLCLLLTNNIGAQEMNNNNIYQVDSLNHKGELASKDNFTGSVWVNLVVNPDDHFNNVVANVVFEPSARTNWHSHPGGQILIVTQGVGYYQEKGKPAQSIGTGDVVKIPANVQHWHGASPDGDFIHIAIVPNLDKGNTVWLNSVTDEEYKNSCSDSSKEPVKIKLTDAAIKNHDQLWPNYCSKAKQTDPELIEVFDNFAFDEVIRQGNLDTKTRIMMIMGSTIASHALGEYKMMVNAALNVGVTPIEVKEILYQSVPYVGISKVIDFISITNTILTARGIEFPLEGQSTTTAETRFEKGMELQKSIFGEMIAKMYKNSPENQLHIQKYLSANCFGDYYTRNGLNIQIRELLTFSMLISMGGTESQVKGHIIGNVKVGNNKETLLSVTTQLLPYIGYPRTLNALKCLNEVIPE